MKLLFSKINLELIDSYKGSEHNYFALKSGKYIVSGKIGNVDRVLDEGFAKHKFAFDEFIESNKYNHQNAKIFLEENGLSPIPYEDNKFLIYEGKRIFVNVEKEEEVLGHILKFKYKIDFTKYRKNKTMILKSDSRNPYIIENMQKIIDLKKWDFSICGIYGKIGKNTKLILSTKRGNHIYKTITEAHSITRDRTSYPQLFSRSNPYVIENIKTFCEAVRSDYILLSDTYIDAHKKLSFEYIGKEKIKIGQSREFQMSWSNFAQMRNPGFFVVSQAESVLLNELKKYGLNVGTQIRLEGCKYKNFLKFDAIVFQEGFKFNSLIKEDDFKNILLIIEYQGIFHYEDIYGDLSEQQKRDNIKKAFCTKKELKFKEMIQTEKNMISNELVTILSEFNEISFYPKTL